MQRCVPRAESLPRSSAALGPPWCRPPRLPRSPRVRPGPPSRPGHAPKHEKIDARTPNIQYSTVQYNSSARSRTWDTLALALASIRPFIAKEVERRWHRRWHCRWHHRNSGRGREMCLSAVVCRTPKARRRDWYITLSKHVVRWLARGEERKDTTKTARAPQLIRHCMCSFASSKRTCVLGIENRR